MPAEWEPHSGCYLVWPERPDNWRLGAKPAQEAWVRVVEAISSGDAVTVLTSYGQWANARARLPEHVRVLETTTNDAWVRDSGPTLLTDDRGGLGAGRLGLQRVGRAAVGSVLPRGTPMTSSAPRSPSSSGRRTGRATSSSRAARSTSMARAPCSTTEECLLNPNRNPDRTREAIEAVLGDHLGVDRVIWLPLGVVDDETDGHVDTSPGSWRPAWSP